MTTDDLICALRRLKVETGSLACLGCGHEHNCGTRGCAIIREAEATISALLADLREVVTCEFCKHEKTDPRLNPCKACMHDPDVVCPSWEWRGVDANDD